MRLELADPKRPPPQDQILGGRDMNAAAPHSRGAAGHGLMIHGGPCWACIRIGLQSLYNSALLTDDPGHRVTTEMPRGAREGCVVDGIGSNNPIYPVLPAQAHTLTSFIIMITIKAG